MVQIIDENRRPTLGEQFGREFSNLGKQIPDAMRLQRENTALEEQGLNVRGITDPATRRQLLADQLTFGRKMKFAKAQPGLEQFTNQIMSEENLPNGGEQVTEETVSGELPVKTQRGGGKEYSTGGQLPQEQTTGNVRKIFTPEEVANKATQLQTESANRGIPLSYDEAFDKISRLNDENKNYNQSVEADRLKRKVEQREYGEIAESKIDRLIPDANDDIRSLFKKKGEQMASQNKSEAQINKELSAEARKYKNMIANAKASTPAPRLFSKLKSIALGQDEGFDKQRSNLRLKLNPLLKEGLYDTARGVLSELGYGPEESESILDDLGQDVKKQLIDMQEFKKPFAKEQLGIVPRYADYTPEESDRFKESLQNILTNNPNANLVLLRRGFEEKGVDWRLFKEGLNELYEDGIFEPSDNQFNRMDVLDQPPLNNLEKILHGVGLIGR